MRDSQPWQRQEGETDPAWSAFVLYRDEPDFRSCAKVAEALKSETLPVIDWYMNHDWAVRAEAYDRWRTEQRTAGSSMDDRHQQMARALQGAAALALNKIVALEKADGTPAQLDAKDIKALVEIGTRLERSVQGKHG